MGRVHRRDNAANKRYIQEGIGLDSLGNIAGCDLIYCISSCRPLSKSKLVQIYASLLNPESAIQIPRKQNESNR